MNRKKILIIIVILIILAILVFLVYSIFFNKRTKTVDEKITTIDASEKINKVINDEINFPALSLDGKSIFYYNLKNKTFYQKNLDGTNSKELAKFEDINSVIWSYNGANAVFKVINKYDDFVAKNSPFIKLGTRDGDLTLWSYNFQNRKLSALDKYIKSIIWHPNEQKIIYHYFNEAKTLNYIVSADQEGKNSKIISEIQCFTCEILSVIPKTGEIFFSQVETQDESRIDYYLLNPANKEAKLVVDNAFEVTISPDKKYVLIQKKDRNAYLLNLHDYTQTDLPGKIQSLKTTWSNDSKILLAAIYQGEGVSDKFIRYDTESGKIFEYTYNNQEKINAFNLMLSSDNNAIYFLSNNFLYKLEL